MRQATKLTPLALSLLVSMAYAGSENDLESLRQKIAGGETQAAWQQAQQLRSQWEADPGFDYLYGTLALQQKKYNEAQFSLERVVIADPANLEARVALAEAYYQLGDKQSAGRQYDMIKQANPPADILRKINQRMSNEPQHEGRLMGFVEATLGHDNNINSATSDDSVPNPNAGGFFQPDTLAIDPEARKQSDMYHAEQLGVDYYHPFDASNGMELRGRIGNRDNFSSDRFDSSSYRMSGSLYHLLGQQMLRGTLAVQDYRISDSDHHQFYGLSGDWLGHDYAGWDLFASVHANELNYDDDLRDVRQYIVKGGIQRQFGDFRHTAGVTAGDEHALNGDADYNARQFSGLFYDVRYTLSGQHQLFARLYEQWSDQKGQEPFFVGETRDDTLQQASMGWDWQLMRPLRLRTEAAYSHNDSDVGYYSYERSWVQTSLRYSF